MLPEYCGLDKQQASSMTGMHQHVVVYGLRVRARECKLVLHLRDLVFRIWFMGQSSAASIRDISA